MPTSVTATFNGTTQLIDEQGIIETANETNGTHDAATPKTTKGTITRDPEVVALVKITGLIDALDDESKTRVLTFLANKYGFGS